MAPTPTVFVYDDAFETSEVLAAVYQPRGFQVERIPSPRQGDSGTTEPGAVVVLRSSCPPAPQPDEPPLRVVIGRATAGAPPTDTGHVTACRMSSLFDYRELVSAIDRLLCDRV